MAEAMKNEKKEVHRGQPLIQGRLQEESFARTKWFARAAVGTKVEDLLDVEYWRHVAASFKEDDEITVITEDKKWHARFLVVASDRLWVKVKLLEQHDLEAETKELPPTMGEDYFVKWKGNMAKFCVIRKSDNVAMKEGLTSQVQAFQWLEEYLKTISA